MDHDRKAYEVGLQIIKKVGVEHKIEFVESQALPLLDNPLEDVIAFMIMSWNSCGVTHRNYIISTI